jgi:uncharacterized membrane protein
MDLIVTIVPAQRADRYQAIKKFCYVENPIANQVIVTKTISNEKKLNVSRNIVSFITWLFQMYQLIRNSKFKRCFHVVLLTEKSY